MNFYRWLAEQRRLIGARATEAERFLSTRRAAGHTRYCTARGLRPLLTYLQRLGVVPLVAAPINAVDVMLARYGRYLTSERGL